MSKRRIAREIALWIGGILGGLSLLSLLAGWLLGVTPLVFASGSMTPAYGVGSLGLAHHVPAHDLSVGDVVSVTDTQGARVTHRIVSISTAGEGAVLTLRGDANNVDDTQTYAVTGADRVILDVPYAGYVVNTLSSPVGLVLSGLFAAGLLYLAFAPVPGSGQSASARKHALVAVGAVSALAVGGGLGVTGQTPWTYTSATWSDSATANATITATAPADTTAPTVTMTYPTGGTVNNGQWTNNGCTTAGKSAGLCGTAADNVGGSGLASGAALYELRRTSVSPNTCWNGTAFTQAACGSYQSAGGTMASWSIPLAFGSLPNGTFELRVKVTDVAGNSNRVGATPPGTPSGATVTFTN